MKERKRYSEFSDYEKTLSRARSKKYYYKHKEKINAKHRATPVSDKQKLAKQKWEKTEKGKLYRAYVRIKRKTLLNNLTELDEFCLKEAYRLCKLREKQTKVKWEIDHIVPVSKGGTNKYHNIQVVPAVWNRRKYNLNTSLWISANQGDMRWQKSLTRFLMSLRTKTKVKKLSLRMKEKSLKK
jgi:CRISPR/Cas system Type II protein with McrA/HNH and RuvC-like nuclease domain